MNQSLTAIYSPGKSSTVRPDVMNVLGQRVANLYQGNRQAGLRRILWSLSGITIGQYIVALQSVKK
jgi:hypothetical protein